jgi:YidC/Oxa1 family membrane protein insertase
MALLLLAAEKKQFWILDPLYTALGSTLAWLYGIAGDHGLAIVLLTVAVRIVLIPLTVKQIRSMKAMQELQPEIKRLQAKYKDDRQKLNEEMMKFYRERKVNPLSGCLPLLLQMPLFIVLYRLINDLVPKVNGVPRPPKHIPKDSELYRSLLNAAGEPIGKISSWGMDLAQRATGVSGGFGKVLPYYLLIGVVAATGWYQQKQATARTAADGVINQQAQLMGKIFPVFFALISLSIPAGVVVYFAASNVWQIGQQAVMFRRQSAAGTRPSPPTDAEAGKPRKPPPPATAGDGKGSKPGPKPAPKPKPSAPRSGSGGSGRASRGGDGARGSRARPKGKPKRR